MEPPPPGALSNSELEKWASVSVDMFSSLRADHDRLTEKHDRLTEKHEDLTRTVQELKWTMDQRFADLSSCMEVLFPSHLFLLAADVWNWAAGDQWVGGPSPDGSSPIFGKFARMTDPQKSYEIQRCARRLTYRGQPCRSQDLIEVADHSIYKRNRRHHYRSAELLASDIEAALKFIRNHPELDSDFQFYNAIWTIQNFQVIREEFGF